jgi:hypothetical protein
VQVMLDDAGGAAVGTDGAHAQPVVPARHVPVEVAVQLPPAPPCGPPVRRGMGAKPKCR